MRVGPGLKARVDAALTRRGIRLDEQDPARRELELAFLDAERRALEGINARLRGEMLPTPAPQASAHEVGSSPRSQGITLLGSETRDSSGWRRRRPQIGITQNELVRKAKAFICENCGIRGARTGRSAEWIATPKLGFRGAPS
jgi:hypothetical protein